MAVDEFWEFERAGWELTAARYEQSWTDTRLFVAPLLDAAAVRSGSRLLDVACGPGFVSEAAALRGADPVGLDVAAAMVEQARRRSPGLRFIQGDAMRLPFADETFDAVTTNFGVLHFSKPKIALLEAQRVLVPGGRLAFTAWVAEGNAAAQIVDAAVGAHALPVRLPQGPPFYHFADHSEARHALIDAGFDSDSIRAQTVTAPWHINSDELLFQAEIDAGVRIGTVIRAQPPERLEAIRAAIVDGVRRYADGDGFTLPIVARVISARVQPDNAR
jgi:SAM-dependent methyltransferase